MKKLLSAAAFAPLAMSSAGAGVWNGAFQVSQSMTVHFIDVGQAFAALIDSRAAQCSSTPVHRMTPPTVILSPF